MWRILSLALMLTGLAGFAAPPALAQKSLFFQVEGTNPGGTETYTGTVTMTQTGDAVKVVWKVGNKTTVGTGIINGSTLAVGYPYNNGQAGVALYTQDGQSGTVSGTWVSGSGRSLGAERWTPQ